MAEPTASHCSEFLLYYTTLSLKSGNLVLKWSWLSSVVQVMSFAFFNFSGSQSISYQQRDSGLIARNAAGKIIHFLIPFFILL